jgi:hypothetical protein
VSRSHAVDQIRYLTTEDVALKYRTQPATVRYWRHIGYGPRGVRVGRRVLYPESEVERFDAELATQIRAEACTV